MVSRGYHHVKACNALCLIQEGHCKPGEVLFGTDSHTCNAGAFGQFATGVGNTDAGFILGTGKLLIKVCLHAGAACGIVDMQRCRV